MEFDSPSKDWVRSIEDDLEQRLAEGVSIPKPVCSMFTVDPDLRKVKSEHYSPQEISLGLFHRSPLTGPKTPAEQCRLGIACTFLSAVFRGTLDVKKDWEKLCIKVVPDPKNTQDLYDERGRAPLSSKEVQSVLTLDAIFLACYVGFRASGEYHIADQASLYRQLDAPTSESRFVLFMSDMALIGRDTHLAIMRDIVKVENQIPLYLIQNALSNIFLIDDLAEKVLRQICLYVTQFLESELPGFSEELRSNGLSTGLKSWRVSETDNLLNYGYRSLVRNNKPHIKIWTHGESLFSSDEYISFPSATRLRQAGIKFRVSSKGGIANIEFQKGLFGPILYLPTFNMGGSTNEIWRNLLAFEQIEQRRVSQWRVSQYVERPRLEDEYVECWRLEDDYCHLGCYMDFMYNLIKEEKDIVFLKEIGVIRGKQEGRYTMAQQIENYIMAEVFHGGLIQNCSIYVTPSWNSLKMDIYNYYNQVPRKLIVEFMGNIGYLSKPWFVLSTIGAFIVVVSLIIQTCYIVLNYYSS